jgi:hypothetical protein
VPALGLAGRVLQRESEDGAALLDGGLALTLVGGERGVDGVEGRGGRELVCVTRPSAFVLSSLPWPRDQLPRMVGGGEAGGDRVPFLKDIVTCYCTRKDGVFLSRSKAEQA